MSEAIKLLDHGMIRLVEHMGSDLSIVRNARVSYDAAWRAGEDEGSDTKLIKYLYRNGHNTPFESVEFQFEVKVPIFIIRQWHRHRTWGYNEISARYKELLELFYVPEVDQITTQHTDNKQMRTDEQHANAAAIRMLMEAQNHKAFKLYKDMIGMGVPRELARTVLPTATYTHMFAKVDLHNLFHFLAERLNPHAQYEIRVYAEAILKLITPIVPVAAQAFVDKHFPEGVKV